MTYTYECSSRTCVGKTYEIEQKMNDKPVEDCPDCGAKGFSRVIQPSTFVLKGRGWAADGYSRSSK